MTHIAVDAVSKTFAGRPPVHALRDVSLAVPAGTITAVVGASGCGKTTLLRVLAGFERPDGGVVSIGGEVVAGPATFVPPERRNVGIVPQDGALFPHHDVAGNGAFALRGRRRRSAARVAELLDLVGLPGYERRAPHQLSGGQQQRVAVARALAPRPTVVLLDEPFTALDATLRTRLRDDVAAVLRDAAATAIVVTHDPQEALAMADHVAVMRAGRIVQAGPSREVYEQPVDAATARLLGDVQVIEGRMLDVPSSGGRVRCALGVLDVHQRGLTGAVQVLVRPEQLVADPASPVCGRVVAVRFRGPDVHVDLELGGPELGGPGDRRDAGRAGTTVTARWASTRAPEPGAAIGIRVDGAVTAVVPAPADEP